MKKTLKEAIEILLCAQNARVVRFITYKNLEFILKIKREDERLHIVLADEKGFVLDEFSVSASENLVDDIYKRVFSACEVLKAFEVCYKEAKSADRLDEFLAPRVVDF